MTRKMTMIKKTLMMVLMMTFGINVSWGQQMTNFEGAWYIACNGNAYEAGTNTTLSYTYNSKTPATNFYLRPAADPQLEDKTDAFFDGTTQTKPFLTSNYTGHTDIALWILEKTDISYTITTPSSGVDYYYTIRHVETGKYVVCDPFLDKNKTLGDENNTRRKTMHLETKDWTTEIPDKALFRIRYTKDESTVTDNFDSYCFIPKLVENKTFKYLNLADRNQPVNYGTNRSNTSNYYGGLAGLYKLNNNIVDDNSRFKFEPYVVEQPTITFNNATNEVTITATEGSIYYTTNGDTPTSALMPHTSPVTFTQTTPCSIKAIAVKSWNSGVEISSEETSYNLQKVATPTITINADNSVTITCSTTDATIYYKLGGDVPTTANGIQSSTIASMLPSQGPIKAIAAKEGWLNSSVAEESTIPAKTVNSPTIIVTGTYTYNGEEQEPTVTVKDGETVINETEYTVSYGNNINAGTNTATITITDNTGGDYNVSGASTFSIDQKPLTITAKPNTITYGDAPAGNGVTYSGFIEGESENTEGMFTGTLGYTYSYSQFGNVGTYTITPGGLTSDNYNISYVNGTLTVNPKALTITAEAKSKVYGDPDPTLTYTSEGLVNGDAITGALSRVSGEDVGDYNITQGTLAAPNYTITYTVAKLKITQKTLTVTANPKTITYGDKPTNDGVTYSGFAYYENENFLLGTLAYAYNYEQYGNVGNYTITPSGLINDNYNITFASGTLTVEQKEVGLIWSETTSFPYDGTTHCLTATATGLVNSDEIGVTVSGEQTNAGNYTATASGLTGTKAGNYKLPADNTQGFTITKAALSVTAADNTITYGQAPSGNGVTYDGFVNSETGGVLEGTVDYDYSYTQFGDVGDYTITPKGLTSNNYDISFVAGTLTVGPKEVGITWDGPTSFEYNGSAQAPTATATGMVNNDAITVAVLDAQTNAGNYIATASLTGDKAGNYKLPTNNTQSFTISCKSIVDGTTLDSHYTLDFGEGNTILLTDDVIGSALVINTDYSVGEDTDPSDKYSKRTVTGIGNYTGYFDVRNVVISFTTNTDQEEWSATFAAENAGGFDLEQGLALPEGVSAFIISDIEGEWAIPEPLNYIPKGVPVLLVAHNKINGFVPTKAENGDVTPIPITPDQEARNMLEEVTADTPGYDAVTQSAPFATKKIYLLYKNEFVFNKAGNLKKGKVYLNPNHTASSPEPAPARLQIAWNYTTGIKDEKWKMEDGSNERWYTLDGRQLQGKPTTKGLYINNGNKVVIK